MKKNNQNIGENIGIEHFQGIQKKNARYVFYILMCIMILLTVYGVKH